MRRALFCLWCAAALAPAGEVIDCIAASVGRVVITRSAIEEQARITAFLNRESASITPATLRRTTERLVDVALIRREMEISRYAAVDAKEVDKLLAGLRSGRAALKPEDFARALEDYRVDESALRRYLSLQTQTLRFVELRFRPGSSVTDGEVELFYRDHFVPEFTRSSPGKAPPELDDVRDKIEASLLEQRVDQSMEQWLKEARLQTRVTLFEESCR
jgi:hypothetical protein